MALPSSGAIDSDMVLAELGRSGPLIIPDDADVRALTGIASGQIILPDDFWGKALAYVNTGTHPAGTSGWYNFPPEFITNSTATDWLESQAQGIFVYNESDNTLLYSYGTNTNWDNISSVTVETKRSGSSTTFTSTLQAVADRTDFKGTVNLGALTIVKNYWQTDIFTHTVTEIR